METITEQKEHKANVIEFAFYTGQLVYYEEAETGKVVEGQIQQMIYNGMDRVYKLYDDNPIPAELVDGVVAESALSAESGELSEYAKAKNALRLERQRVAIEEAEANLAAQKLELEKIEGQVV
ncbi:hypothetical protein CCB80_03335 [Armatimonadetes bacterium Uphvl-Ar1]|nr:hypothetical protein CCB80_03335 [Armatimonadetes bacterium Uphvl-Ar1]